MNIRATASGVIVGMLLGGPAAVQAYDKVTKNDPGYTVHCTGNGEGGYRHCTVDVTEAPGAPVHRVDYDLTVNGEFFIGLNVFGINGKRHDALDVGDTLRTEVRR